MEVYYNGKWGTVCHDGWDLNDAEVVCRELGYAPAVNVRNSGLYGWSSGQIWLDDVTCVGTEITIANCSHEGWGSHDCDHNKDAGVICTDPNGM